MDSKKPSSLIAALLLSVAVNVGLITSLIFIALSDRDGREVVSEPLAHVTINKELSSQAQNVVNDYFKKSFRELVSLLEDTTPVAEGIVRRDIALSCLVCFHSFHIEKALGGLPFEVRNYSITNQDGGEQIAITFFPDLNDDTFAQINRFTRMEKWPLTPKGLFHMCKSGKESRSLTEAFFQTNLFSKLYKAFTHSGVSISKKDFASLIVHGNWEELQQIVRRLDPQNEQEAMHQVLAHLVKERSVSAAELLVMREEKDLVAHGKNEEIISLVELVKTPSEEVLRFLGSVAEGIRPRYVKERAEKKLCMMAEAQAKTGSQAGARAGSEAQARNEVIPEIEPQKYIVKPGDSLWKIAVKFNVPLRTLRDKNQLGPTPVIHPGQVLIIP